MATAAPHVKLLRQLASAKDDYLSGAFDISWDGAKATLYLVFGRPSHAVFETDQAQIEGEAAIDALLAALPRVFSVSDWRRAMSPHETLSITIDELAGPFVRLAGSYADDPVTDESPEWWSAVDDSPDLPFGLADFPLLPGGRPLWIEASPDEVHLADRLAELPPSILMLTGAKLRAAAVVSGGDLIDAVWIDADDHARGETAGMAILGATKGSLAGYALDDPRVAESLTMLWRLPVAVSDVELSWLDPASMLAAFRADGLDRVLVIDAPVRGIALFSRGGLVAVYSETQRSAVASPERLRSLLSQARGRLTVMERKPRPLAADTTPAPASARDFFEVTPPDPAPVASPDAEHDAAPDVTPDAAAADSPPAVDETGAEDGETDAPHTVGDTADDLAPPPPPPPDEQAAAEAGDVPPALAPAPEAARSEPKPKRSRWGFGRSRKSRAERRAAGDAAAKSTGESPESAGSEAATFAGWSIRQPNAGTQPVWYRSQDPAGTPPAAPDPDSGEADGAAPTWSVAHPVDDAPPPADAPAADERPSTDDPPVADSALVASDAPVAADAADAALAAETPDAEAGPEVGADETTPLLLLQVPSESAPIDEPSVEPAEVGAADPLDQGHLFEFDSEDEPAPEAASESWLSSSWLDDVAHGETSSATTEQDITPDADASEHTDAGPTPDEEPNATADLWAEAPVTDQDHGAEPSPRDEPVADHGDLDAAGEEAISPGPVLRTPGPWSWPLAEPDEEPRGTAGAAAASHSSDEPDALEPQTADGATPASDDDADSAFFHRDEPVGSQYVDFDEVRNELVQIGIVWLGETNAGPVTALLSSTRSTIDDFVATIDTIRGLHLEGQDPASIQAMAREMHQQAAERLCGA
ncbi:MAG TPA: hypothetical protein VND54_01300 [Candidatus Saccharimonadales bacterium]|nr:hypothetical protein [Candidatus Saccharimonadales bacterium]